MDDSEFEIHENLQKQVIKGGIKKLLSAVESLSNAEDPRSFAVRTYAAESALKQIETGLENLATRKAEHLELITRPRLPARQSRMFEGTLDLAKIANAS